MIGYPLLDLFLTMLYFFAWILWILLMFWIIWDIFRSRDLSGWAKAAWLIFVIVLPLVGILAYLIARGGSMHERQAREVQAQDEAFRAYVRDAAGSGDGHGSSDELTRLAGLHDRGVLNDQEFQQAKARVLS
jgi:type VI protein secretion system component VasK